MALSALNRLSEDERREEETEDGGFLIWHQDNKERKREIEIHTTSGQRRLVLSENLNEEKHPHFRSLLADYNSVSQCFY